MFVTSNGYPTKRHISRPHGIKIKYKKHVGVWFQASTVMQLRTSLFWVITRQAVVISYWHFGTTYWSHPQRSRITPFLWFLLCPSYTTQTLLLLSLYTLVKYQEITTPLWITVLLNCLLFLSPSFSCPLVRIITLLGLPTLHVVIYHGVALNHNIYPSCFFSSLFITSCCTDFYSYVLCSSLISTSSLPCPCPSLNYSVQCTLALHVVVLPC